MTNMGFFRVAACSPAVAVGNCMTNALEIIKMAREAAAKGAELVVFPELSVTGYTCADLFHNAQLLSNADEAIKLICDETASLPLALVVGAPYLYRGTLYNCAFVIASARCEALCLRRLCRIITSSTRSVGGMLLRREMNGLPMPTTTDFCLVLINFSAWAA